MSEYITITKEEYDELKDAEAFLQCLEACGVDNWEGLDAAVDMYNEGDN